MQVKIAIAILLLIGLMVTAEARQRVNYHHYALDGWMGAICLPDDCFKCLVNADGCFSTEFGKSEGHQGIYPNPPAQKAVWIQAGVLGRATRVSQEMYSARVPIAITRKRDKEIAITEYLFAARPLDWTANRKGEALRGRTERTRLAAVSAHGRIHEPLGTAEGRQGGIKVARALASSAGMPGSFKNFHNGAFSEPSLPQGFDKGKRSFFSVPGGKSTTLFDSDKNATSLGRPDGRRVQATCHLQLRGSTLVQDLGHTVASTPKHALYRLANRYVGGGWTYRDNPDGSRSLVAPVGRSG